MRELRVAGALLAVDAVTREVSRAFERGRVTHIILKGPSVGRWLFGEEPTHVSTDVDVLVAPGSVELATAVLERQGFVPLLLDIARGDRPNHARPFRRDSSPVAVDLHRTLLGAGSTSEAVWHELLQHRVVDEGLPVLDVPARLLHLALHAWQNGVRNRRTVDYVTRAIEIQPEDAWRAASEIAIRLGAVTPFAIGLSLAPSGGGVVERLGLDAEATLIDRLRIASAPNPAHALEWLLRLGGPQARGRFVLGKLFPPPAFMRSWLPLANRGRLGLGAAYFFRIGWLAVNLPSALSFWLRAH